jgi:hypothetical protein
MMDTSSPPDGRFVTWFALAVFNTIALVAFTSELDKGDLKDETREYKWSISSVIVTLALSILGVFGHTLKGKFVGTPIEGGLVSIPLSFLLQTMIANSDGETTGFLRSLLTFIPYTSRVLVPRLSLRWACGVRSFLR